MHQDVKLNSIFSVTGIHSWMTQAYPGYMLHTIIQMIVKHFNAS